MGGTFAEHSEGAYVAELRKVRQRSAAGCSGNAYRKQQVNRSQGSGAEKAPLHFLRELFAALEVFDGSEALLRFLFGSMGAGDALDALHGRMETPEAA